MTWPVPHACALTRAVAAMDSCLAHIGAHQHGIAVGPLYVKGRLQKPFTAKAGTKHSFNHQLHTPHVPKGKQLSMAATGHA